MKFTCEQIGMTQAELRERVVQGLVNKILGLNRHNENESYNEDGDFIPEGAVLKEVNKQIEITINQAVSKIAADHIYPMAKDLITDHIFQKTTSWGEKEGRPMSFIEYLAKRTEEHFSERVDSDGRSREEMSGRLNWRDHGSRAAVMVDQSIESFIRPAMDAAVENVHATLAEALAETVKTKLAEIAAALEVRVATK